LHFLARRPCRIIRGHPAFAAASALAVRRVPPSDGGVFSSGAGAAHSGAAGAKAAQVLGRQGVGRLANGVAAGR